MKADHALKNTIKKMVPAVLIAMISTALGLLSLYQSKVPMINDFGSMLTIGIGIAFIIAVFIFIPFLYIRDKHFSKDTKKINKKSLKQNHWMKKPIGQIINAKYIIITLSILLAIIGIYFDQDAKAETDLENFMPQNSQALADIKELRETIGSTEQIAIIFEGEYILDNENLVIVDDIQQELSRSYEDEIIESTSLLNIMQMMGIQDTNLINSESINQIPEDMKKLFINESLTKTLINVSIVEMSDELFHEFLNNLEKDISELNTELKITITGQSVIDSEMMIALTTGRYQITLIGIVLIFISLLIIYKSLYRAILPIIPILIIVGWSGGIMALFNMSYTPLTATLGALIMGIGTEFTILISERFEEEKRKTNDRQLAIKNAVSIMANPILVSALTTMGGFSALIFSDFVILSNFGIMTLVNLSFALLSTLIVLPAVLAITFSKDVKVLEPLTST